MWIWMGKLHILAISRLGYWMFTAADVPSSPCSTLYWPENVKVWIVGPGIGEGRRTARMLDGGLAGSRAGSRQGSSSSKTSSLSRGLLPHTTSLPSPWFGLQLSCQAPFTHLPFTTLLLRPLQKVHFQKRISKTKSRLAFFGFLNNCTPL